MEMPRCLVWTLSFLFFSAAADPQIIPLNRILPSATWNINSVEGGSNLYLASIDDKSVLKNIIATTGGSSFTLDTLNAYSNDGTAKSLLLGNDLSISTANTNAITANLTGILYLTTRNQADDPNFSVYVIKDQHLISTKPMKSTIVILNTWLPEFIDEDEPRRLSYVTGIQQASTVQLSFQWGIPPENWNTVNNNNTFFMNPMVLTNITTTTSWFFDHIEPLQIGLDYWYLTSDGAMSMKIEKKYVPNRNYTTTAVNTTGLIVNDFLYQEHQVHFLRDDTRSGVSGLFVSLDHIEKLQVTNSQASAFIPYGSLTFDIQSGYTGIKYELDRRTQIGWLYYAEDQATTLIVSTTTNTPGTFYCQYFTHAGQLYPVTTTVTTTAVQTTAMGEGVSTTTVGTSTKGSGRSKGLGWIMLMGILSFKFCDY